MIKLLIVFFIGFGIYMEFWGIQRLLHNLFYIAKYDKDLIEPGEKIELTHFVTNYSRVPVLFFSMSMFLHKDVRFLEDEQWMKVRTRKYLNETAHNYKFYMMGNSQWSDQTHFTFDKRGCYRFGHNCIEVGDAFGLRSAFRELDVEQEIVVMPGKMEDAIVWLSYSGFIGNISVNRFILEDPVLTVGFREYTGHEPMKSISFSQTAKMGSMYVKCYDHTAEFHVTILLNMNGGKEEELEKCLEIARTVIEDLEDRHISYGFASNGDVVDYLAPGLGMQHYKFLMKRMGLSKLYSVCSLENFLQKYEKNHTKSSGFILITPPLDNAKTNVVTEFERKLSTKVCILVGDEENE